MQQVFPQDYTHVFDVLGPASRQWIQNKPRWVKFLSTVHERVAAHINGPPRQSTTVSFQCSPEMVSDMNDVATLRGLFEFVGLNAPTDQAIFGFLGLPPLVEREVSVHHPSIGVPIFIVVAFKRMFDAVQRRVPQLIISAMCKSNCSDLHSTYLCFRMDDRFDAPLCDQKIVDSTTFFCDHLSTETEA